MRNRVRELREAAGLTQVALGDLVGGVSRQTIISIEKGHYDPSLKLGIAIARQFGLPVEEVFHADPTN